MLSFHGYLGCLSCYRKNMLYNLLPAAQTPIPDREQLLNWLLMNSQQYMWFGLPNTRLLYYYISLLLKYLYPINIYAIQSDHCCSYVTQYLAHSCCLHCRINTISMFTCSWHSRKAATSQLVCKGISDYEHNCLHYAEELGKITQELVHSGAAKQGDNYKDKTTDFKSLSSHRNVNVYDGNM